jgi:hypothetical protein
MGAAAGFGNLHAVLVHERLECVFDLVANLRHLDPASTVLLYDGTGGQLELDRADVPLDRGVLVHPAPRRIEWGRLHDFAVDVLRFALASTDVDAVTMVDSDQLAVGGGYSSYLGAFLRTEPGVGMLASLGRPESGPLKSPGASWSCGDRCSSASPTAAISFPGGPSGPAPCSPAQALAPSSTCTTTRRSSMS